MKKQRGARRCEEEGKANRQDSPVSGSRRRTGEQLWCGSVQGGSGREALQAGEAARAPVRARVGWAAVWFGAARRIGLGLC